MYQGHATGEPFPDPDRNLGDALREVNELRRSRSLPEYQPTTTDLRVLPRQPSHCRLRARLRVDQ